MDAENLEKDHSLVMLANKFKAVAEKEYTLFSPVLCQQYPEAGIVAAVLLHQLYGKHLVCYMNGGSLFECYIIYKPHYLVFTLVV